MKELEPLINQTIEMIKGTQNFVVAQAPEFVKEFILYSYIGTIGWLTISAIFFGIILKFSFWLKKNWDYTSEPTSALGILGIIVGGFISIYGIVGNIFDLIWIKFAPKVYLVMHLADCLKVTK